jgi:uncharacterized membrane protein SpoIIM required for sporulation
MLLHVVVAGAAGVAMLAAVVAFGFKKERLHW